MAISKGEVRVAILAIEYVMDERRRQIEEGSARTPLDDTILEGVNSTIAHLTSELAYLPEVATDPKTGRPIE